MPPMFQLTTEQKDTVVTTFKLGGAWGSVWAAHSADIANMAQAIASIAAATYTTFLCIEFICKKVIAPLYRWMKNRANTK